MIDLRQAISDIGASMRHLEKNGHVGGHADCSQCRIYDLLLRSICALYDIQDIQREASE